MSTLPLSSLSIYLFGVPALLSGISSLSSPSRTLGALGLPPTATPATNANAAAAIAIGVYYCLAAYQAYRWFFVASVPTRLVSAAVFWRNGGPWRRVAVWEGGLAVCTACVLAWEW